jgi:hypothetical protein
MSDLLNKIGNLYVKYYLNPMHEVYGAIFPPGEAMEKTGGESTAVLPETLPPMPAVVILRVPPEPVKIVRGATKEIVVSGTNLLPTDEFKLLTSIVNDGISVRAQFVSSQEIKLTIQVPADAALGRRGLVMWRGDGPVAQLSGVIEVVDRLPQGKPASGGRQAVPDIWGK